MFESTCWLCLCTFLGSSTPCPYHMAEIGRAPSDKTVTSSVNRISGQTLFSDIFNFKSVLASNQFWAISWDVWFNLKCIKSISYTCCCWVFEGTMRESRITATCIHRSASFQTPLRTTSFLMTSGRMCLVRRRLDVNEMRPFGEVKALLESQSFNRMSWDHEDLKDNWC